MERLSCEHACMRMLPCHISQDGRPAASACSVTMSTLMHPRNSLTCCSCLPAQHPWHAI